MNQQSYIDLQFGPHPEARGQIHGLRSLWGSLAFTNHTLGPDPLRAEIEHERILVLVAPENNITT